MSAFIFYSYQKRLLFILIDSQKLIISTKIQPITHYFTMTIINSSLLLEFWRYKRYLLNDEGTKGGLNSR